MYTFICQKIDDEIAHDFVLATKQSVEYMNWYNNEKGYEIDYVEDITEINYVGKEVIPIGTVEFVEQYYKEFYGIELKPINIPNELIDYTQRNIWYGNETTKITKDTFCKSTDKVKSFTDIINKNTQLSHGNYMFSELIEIESEWRCFVYKGQILGIHNYINSVDMTYYPNTNTIKEMVELYKGLDAYTLDVGVNDKGTFVIEVHDFYSCGLYGFRDFTKLLYMNIASHNQKLKNIK